MRGVSADTALDLVTIQQTLCEPKGRTGLLPEIVTDGTETGAVIMMKRNEGVVVVTEVTSTAKGTDLAAEDIGRKTRTGAVRGMAKVEAGATDIGKEARAGIATETEIATGIGKTETRIDAEKEAMTWTNLKYGITKSGRRKRSSTMDWNRLSPSLQ